jgi:hypothetical protein
MRQAHLPTPFATADREHSVTNPPETSASAYGMLSDDAFARSRRRLGVPARSRTSRTTTK